MGFLKKVSDGMEKFGLALAAFLVMVMFCLVFSGVILRVIGNSFSMSEELSRWCLISLCFIGGSVALKQKQHIGVNMLLQSLPPAAAKIGVLISYIVVFLFLGFATVYSAIAAVASRDMTGDIIPVSMIYIKFSLPLGMFMMLVHLLNRFLGIAKAKDIQSILIGS